MACQEGSSSNKAPLFDGTNYAFGKIRMESYLISLVFDVWKSVVNGYTMPSHILTNPAEKRDYENNAKAKNAILCVLSNAEFVKVMHCQTAKELWDKLKSIFEGDDKVKQAKLQTYKAKFEELKVKEEE